MNKRIDRAIDKIPFLDKLIGSRYKRMIFAAEWSLMMNILYAVYNGFIGLIGNSVWFLAMFAYYLIFAIMRGSAVNGARKNLEKDKKRIMQINIMTGCGVMLIILAFVLIKVICMMMENGKSKNCDNIVAAAAAGYTFYKIISASLNFKREHKNGSPLMKTIRSINISDAVLSVLSLLFSWQLSVRISFPYNYEFSLKNRIINIILGAVSCLMIIILGVHLIHDSKKLYKNKGGA